MDDLKRIVVLIDADNTQLHKLESVIREISIHGRIVVKRAYGNWKKELLKHWEEEVKRLAIKAEQQFDYVAGKNATDMALVIDAINLLHTNLYDAFAIVSSDSDFTPLAISLHESGVYVFGVGEKKTPESFINACDEFILLENLLGPDEEKKQKAAGRTKGKGKSKAEAAEPSKNRKSGRKGASQESALQEEAADKPAAPAAGKGKGKKSGQAAEHLQEPAAVDTGAEQTAELMEEDEMEEIHDLLHLIWEKNQDEDGFAHVSSAGTYLKRMIPDFDTRTYGFEKLSKMIKAFPKKYALKKNGKGRNVIVEYRCLD